MQQSVFPALSKLHTQSVQNLLHQQHYNNHRQLLLQVQFNDITVIVYFHFLLVSSFVVPTRAEGVPANTPAVVGSLHVVSRISAKILCYYHSFVLITYCFGNSALTVSRVKFNYYSQNNKCTWNDSTTKNDSSKEFKRLQYPTDHMLFPMN